MSGADGGPDTCARGPLAILCGGGAFPLEVAAEARRAGREPFLVGVVGATDSAIEAYPHVWVRVGEVGKLFAALKGRAIAEMVIIGAMARPEFSDLRLDWGAVRRAAGLAGLNVIGLKRRGFSHETVHELRRAYKMLFNGGGTLKERVDEVAEAFSGKEAVQQIVAFLRQGGDRAICVPRAGREEEG